ncbi:hypothetical protein FH972_016412 [Carpinus fangiana]|uniref:BHLH domain-containing protein n=1 Tax=Carpinus fangiana TaxID=176857 RepID=A0A5N6RH26_9ROSI|nr:hypothetical protein FH972_016412 [Carpinus fangiana]
MGSQENENPSWMVFDDYGLIDDIRVPSLLNPTAFASTTWPPPHLSFSAPTSLSVENEGSFANSDSLKEIGSLKRSILDPGRPPKMDKAVMLSDALRMVTQLRGEAQKLKESKENLQDKINEMKAEKNELRDEKQRLKTEKENLEQQVKALTTQPGFLPHPPAIPAPLSATGQVVGGKLVPFMGYPGVSMWQFMPPASFDTSQDHVLRPPVA